MSDHAPPKRFVSSVAVARLAGVSQSAVSRTFSENGSVSARTREKVLQAAAALDYRPSHIPRIMLTGRSRLIGIVVGGLDNPYYAAVLDRFALALRENGQQVVLVRIDTGLALDGALQRLSAYRVDAVLTAIPVRTEQAAQALSALRIPVICFNADPTAENVFSIRSGNRAAGAQAAELLFARGARRFAFVGAPAVHAASQQRGGGFRDALARLGAAPPVERTGADDYRSGFAIGAELFAGNAPLPDGVFCSNDLMACGVIDALRERGLAVPGQVRLIGYDNIPQAEWRGYDLSSFDQQPDRMIEAALEMLALVLGGGEPAERSRTIPARLVERGSSAAGEG